MLGMQQLGNGRKLQLHHIVGRHRALRADRQTPNAAPLRSTAPGKPWAPGRRQLHAGQWGLHAATGADPACTNQPSIARQPRLGCAGIGEQGAGSSAHSLHGAWEAPLHDMPQYVPQQWQDVVQAHGTAHHNSPAAGRPAGPPQPGGPSRSSPGRPSWPCSRWCAPGRPR